MKKKWFGNAWMQMGLVCMLAVGMTACQKEIPSSESSGSSQTETQSFSSESGTVSEGSSSLDSNDGSETENPEPAGTALGGVPKQIQISVESAPEACYVGDEYDRADSQNLTVVEEGYEPLQNALDELNQLRWQQTAAICAEEADYVRDLMDENLIVCGSVFHTVTMERADERFVSFWDETYQDIGGAHPNISGAGYTLDSMTGKRVALRDVVEDYDGLFDLVISQIPTVYPEEGLIENYGDAVRELFYPEDGSEIGTPWTMNREGITIYFNPGMIAANAAGAARISVTARDHEGMLRSEFFTEGNRYARRVQPGTEYAEDLNGDGVQETFSFAVEYLEELYSSRITIGQEGQSLQQDVHGTYHETYLVRTEEGGCFLYMEFSGDSSHLMEVFRLDGDTPSCMGEAPGALYGSLMGDPESFALYHRIDVLGTYQCYSYYTVGEDGIPVAQEQVNYLVGGRPTVSTRELSVQMYQKETPEEMMTVLSAGTTLYPRSTDGSTYVDVELEDGRRCRLPIERKEYLIFIDGVEEQNCFEKLHYAG